MKVLLISVFMYGAAFTGGVASPSLSPFESRSGGEATQAASRKIDDLVFGKLQKLGIQPANRCSDAVFLRRVFLDVIGTLPTADEAKQFLAETAPDKRSTLIDRLLERPEFGDYWGMKWCDLLRVKAEFPVNLWPNAAQAYDRWIRTSMKQNMAYSRFAWEMLTANGSNFRSPQVNFFRSVGSHDPKAFARAVALTFMGERAEKWPPEKLAAMAVFFSQIGFKQTNEWKEEIVYFKGIDAAHGPKGPATLPDGTVVQLRPDQDPRELFAQWLTSSKNSPFARNAVNRVWYWLMGHGIVNEPDDMRADNPPSNPELLDWLADELVSTTFDMRFIFRLILNSGVYQLACIPASDKPEAERQFAYYPVRRLDAEVLIDALDQLTGATEEYMSFIPEPFTWVPETQRSISLADGSISSAFLDMFGRPSRDTGLLAERNNRPTSAQRLHLLNSTHILSKITKSEKLRGLFRTDLAPAEWVAQVYLTVLSRYPTSDELMTLHEYTAGGAQRWQLPTDLVWALVNSTEFLYRH